MAWFWEKEEPKYDSHEYQYANNPQYKEYYDKYFGDDPNMSAGESLSDKAKIWADKMYQNENNVVDTITGAVSNVAQGAKNFANNALLIGIGVASFLIYIKYFHKKG